MSASRVYITLKPYSFNKLPSISVWARFKSASSILPVLDDDIAPGSLPP